MRWFRFFAVIPALLLGLARAEASVTISGSNGSFYDNTYVIDDPHSRTQSGSASDSSLAIPYNVTVGAGGASTTVSLSQSSFDYQFNDVRPLGPYSQAENYGKVYFKVNKDTPYTFAGQYTMTGGEEIYLTTEFDDVTSSTNNFISQNVNFNGTNSALTVGSSANTVPGMYHFSGSLTGTLYADHTYEFSYNAYIYSIEGFPEDPGASATGDLHLAFGSSVPEPTTIIIWSLLGAIAITVGWHRRNAA
jgi:hypothetical protein